MIVFKEHLTKIEIKKMCLHNNLKMKFTEND